MSGFPNTRGDFVSSLVQVLALALAAWLALIEFRAHSALLFCSILAAVALTGLARRLNPNDRMPHALSVMLSLLVLLVILGGLVWWIGPQLVAQFDQLREEVPRGLQQARQWFESSELGQQLQERLPRLSPPAASPADIVQSTGKFLGAGFSALADVSIGLILAVFLAVHPQRYVQGLVRLWPARYRRRGSEVLAAIGTALRVWLLARGLLMLVIAVLLGVGLLILGIPLALPLALLAGLFSFVPYLGPLLALVPAVAIGLLQSPKHALYVLAVYGAVQLVESYLIEPMVEARAVSLPPALIILAQVIAAVWLGAVGVVIATPLLVSTVVLVQMLYLQGVLGEDVDVAGN